ncbi:MAG: hypothetical protein R3348_04685 [Xanthomonadales bacterium]|nr:hypothetical protein [Xanthomonadales bacterium]
MRKLKIPVLIAAALLALTACEDEGPFEQAGEDIDQSIEDARNEVEDACEDVKEELGAEDKDC